MMYLVTGSRRFTDEIFVRQQLEKLVLRLPDSARIVIIHGGANRGVDLFVHQWCQDFSGVEERIFWPDYVRYYESEAPKMRNSLMVAERPDEVLVFYAKGAENRGTWDCATKAKLTGLKVTEFER